MMLHSRPVFDASPARGTSCVQPFAGIITALKFTSTTFVNSNTAMSQPSNSSADSKERAEADQAYQGLVNTGFIKHPTNINLPTALPPQATTASAPPPSPPGPDLDSERTIFASDSSDRTISASGTPERTMSASGPSPGAFLHVQQPELLNTNDITYATIVARIETLLLDQLSKWNDPQIATLSGHLATKIIKLSQRGSLGPLGLTSVQDIFMVVGHEGPQHYMALAVTAPTSLEIVLKGRNSNKTGLKLSEAPEEMELLTQGFRQSAMVEWQKVNK